MSCPCSAGMCEKFKYTVGDLPHLCSLEDFHEGDHKCANCGRYFNANGVWWKYAIDRRAENVSAAKLSAEKGTK